VPISPYIMPSAMSKPATDTLFCEDMGYDKFQTPKVTQRQIQKRESQNLYKIFTPVGSHFIIHL
jgi:hypothetical protein